MRVIAGSARRMQLISPVGYETRPTSDKTKETLFNVLMPYLGGIRFLDLFAGSGAIGIESLSRGAEYAVFVEKSKNALDVIKKNIHITHFDDKSSVMAMDVMSALHMLEKKGTFDIIFMDPPYGQGIHEEVLYYLSSSSICNEDTIIVVECDNNTEFDYLSDLSMEIFKEKVYKNNKHVFISFTQNKESR